MFDLIGDLTVGSVGIGSFPIDRSLRTTSRSKGVFEGMKMKKGPTSAIIIPGIDEITYGLLSRDLFCDWLMPCCIWSKGITVSVEGWQMEELKGDYPHEPSSSFLFLIGLPWAHLLQFFFLSSVGWKTYLLLWRVTIYRPESRLDRTNE